MQCPHCRKEFHEEFKRTMIQGSKARTLKIANTERYSATMLDQLGVWSVRSEVCPACDNAIVFLECGEETLDADAEVRYDVTSSRLVYPKATSRGAVPLEVSKPLATDYTQACLVLADSPKASAALSRRCLQALLREKANVKQGNLVDEIQQVLDSKSLPSFLAEALDSIRNIGNFATHPMKSEQAGQVVDVEAGEAEWLLDTLELLFDFYFVQPKRTEDKRNALDSKLKSLGKPPMK